MYSPTALATSSIASVASCCVVSTPRPSRVTVERRSISSTRPSSTSATRRRVEFVPMSTTATRMGGAQPSGTAQYEQDVKSFTQVLQPHVKGGELNLQAPSG